ncbi:MAG TPA: S8 family serine peptidase [Actinophytocola sp.]|uniref:S8 family serine peptidase n=1 Tax=Actinophytocola sp. TaxID=1872138 RepID=UPI002DB6D72A|nr:S8 family serine peptidase [Actinophytocola sp.]HEU5469184.1 S8 family serine peptidase [Actinophytocola sp.]
MGAGLRAGGPAGAGAALAVLDSGFNAAHPALRGVEVAGSRSFVGGDPLRDPVGHGTECCSIVVARPGHGGPAGVAPGVRLYVGQVIGAGGWGDPPALCAGLRWAAGLDIDVLAIPLGCLSSTPPLWHAIRTACARGVRVVAAVGNPYLGQRGPLYPAAYPGVTAVGAARFEDTYAAWRTPPDVIVRTVPQVCTPGGGWRPGLDTSHATLHFAGTLCASMIAT